MSKPILRIWDDEAQKYVGVPAVKGNKGEKGDPGITPSIGDNGNWFIGDVDTGKPSRGGGGAYKVNVTTDEVAGIYVADKTFAEILAAYNAGSMPYMVLDAGTGANILALQHVDDSAMHFGYTDIDNNQLVVYMYEITSANDVNEYNTYLDVSSLIL